jgi:hypothetical protein
VCGGLKQFPSPQALFSSRSPIIPTPLLLNCEEEYIDISLCKMILVEYDFQKEKKENKPRKTAKCVTGRIAPET